MDRRRGTKPEIEAFKRRFSCLVSTTWGGTKFNVPTRSSFTLANNRTCGHVAEDRYEVRIADEFDTSDPREHCAMGRRMGE